MIIHSSRMVLVVTLVCLVAAACASVSGATCEADAAASHLTGSGLHPVAPVGPYKQVWVHVKDASGKSVDCVPEVSIVGTEGVVMHNYHLFNATLGLWQVLFNYIPGSTVLSVTLNGRHVRGSPATIPASSAVACDCTENSAQWREWRQCRPFHNEPQLLADMAPWPTIKEKDIDDVEAALLPQNPHFVRYAFLNNKLYGKEYPNGIVGIRTMVEEFLLALARQVRIPDIEFLINYSDYPQLKAGRQSGIIFSMCKTPSNSDILLPTYELLQVVLGRRSTLLVDCKNRKPWEQRTPQLIWRGSDSNRNRATFAKAAQALNHTGLYDVGLAMVIRSKHEESVHGMLLNKTSMCAFFDKKWVASVDGSVAAYRFPSLMAGGSLLVKQDSNFIEHFYKEMEPGKHYIPFREDNADLHEKVTWALEHDDEAKQIGERARSFYIQRLNSDQVACYVYTALQEYAARQTFKPRLRTGMVLVPQPQGSAECNCPSTEKIKTTTPKSDL